MDLTFDRDRELADELRAGVGRDWIEEAAEDERLTELADRRRLAMRDLGREMANRGERVTVTFGGHSFSGAVVSAGDDYVSVEGSGQHADIRLDTATWSIIGARRDGNPGVAHDETLRARLAELADLGNTVRLSLPGQEIVIGRVAVVSADHVEIADVDERKLYVPLSQILGIIRSVEFQ